METFIGRITGWLAGWLRDSTHDQQREFGSLPRADSDHQRHDGDQAEVAGSDTAADRSGAEHGGGLLHDTEPTGQRECSGDGDIEQSERIGDTGSTGEIKMSTTAEAVSQQIQQDAPLVQTAATAASIATGQPEIAALTGVAIALASSIAQIVAQEQASAAKPVTQEQWTAMGVALGAALKAYNAAP